MPYLRDAEAVRGHLREAITGRAHWVFLADCAAGLAVLAPLALAMWSLSDEQVSLGHLQFHNTATGSRANFSVVTAAKALLSREALRAVMRRLGLPAVGRGQDLVLFVPPERLAVAEEFLNVVREGKAWALDDLARAGQPGGRRP
jgi:hypothetical protein